MADLQLRDVGYQYDESHFNQFKGPREFPCAARARENLPSKPDHHTEAPTSNQTVLAAVTGTTANATPSRGLRAEQCDHPTPRFGEMQ
jgi:hypothetical protein